MNIAQRLMALTLGGAFALTAGGCLIMGGSSIEESGTRVSGNTLAQIEPGRTTEAWVIGALGEPTSCVEVEGQPGVKVLRYDHTRCESEGGAVFLIFAGGSEETTKSSAFFESTHGVITRYWTEP